jgi:hypothetical protein
MDNTFFVGINSSVTEILGMAFVSALVIAVLVVGAVTGYRVYKDFVDPVVEWKRGQFIHKSGRVTGEWRPFRGGK